MELHNVLSRFGFWGDVRVAPMVECDSAAGFEYDSPTPCGHAPAVVDAGKNSTYLDASLSVRPQPPEIPDKGSDVMESDPLSWVRAVTEVSGDKFDALLLVSGSEPILETNDCRTLNEPNHPGGFDDTMPHGNHSVTLNYPFTGPPIALGCLPRDAVCPDAQFLEDRAQAISVVMDGPFLTSRSVPESRTCGRAFVAHLASLQHT